MGFSGPRPRASQGSALARMNRVRAARKRGLRPSCHLLGPLFLRMMTGDEKVVDGASQHAAHAGADDRHPPPVMPGPEHLAPPSGHGGEEARTEGARPVDRVAGVEPERHSPEY